MFLAPAAGGSSRGHECCRYRYVDTVMVGASGVGIGSVGLTSTVGWLVSSIAVAFGIGILSVCAQAVGANNDEKVKRVGQQALFLTLIVGIALTIMCVLIAPYLPTWLNGDKAIRGERHHTL